MLPEATIHETGAGGVPAGEGWFVLNARDARWFEKPGQGWSWPMTGADAAEAEGLFPLLGLSLRVMGPGEPSTVYHWETDQEGFLVLAGECVLIVEGQERRLRRWDFVHCPPGTTHAFAGVGDEPCVLLCAGSRVHQADGPWGGYRADPVAARHGASPPHDTDDPAVAYGRFPPSRAARCPEGLLP